jgi:hypothetical protein
MLKRIVSKINYHTKFTFANGQIIQCLFIMIFYNTILTFNF